MGSALPSSLLSDGLSFSKSAKCTLSKVGDSFQFQKMRREIHFPPQVAEEGMEVDQGNCLLQMAKFGCSHYTS